MGYRIVYSRESACPESAGFTGSRLRMMVACWMLLFSLTVKCLWPEGSDMLCRALLPERMEDTQKALQCMMLDIHEGRSVSDALTAFCGEIIDDETDN